MGKIIRITEAELRQIIKEAVHRKLRSDERAYIQPDMFDSNFDSVNIQRPKRVSKYEKEKRKEIKKQEKKDVWLKQQEEDFKNRQTKWGVKQLELFPMN